MKGFKGIVFEANRKVFYILCILMLLIVFSQAYLKNYFYTGMDVKLAFVFVSWIILAAEKRKP